MTTRSAIPDLPPGSAAGVLAFDVATAAAGAAHPEWIKIAPRGPVVCRDTRRFVFDPEALAARFKADAIQVPIDLDHATVHKAPKGETAPAQGWVRTFEARSDGLYGQVDWLPGGKAVLDAKTHRYVSPAFPFDQDGNATWIHSVSLTAAPAIGNMPAVASASPDHQEPSMKGIATAVGLQADANEPAILAAIAAGFVKKDVHEEAVTRLAAATAELTAIKKAGHDAEVERELEAALKAKKMLPAQKPGFAAMAATPEGLVQVKAVLAATAEGAFAAASALEGQNAPAGGAVVDDVATLTAKARVYQKAQHDVGNPIGWAEAVRAVEEKKS